MLCLHIIQSITPPSCHRQDTDTGDQEHWDLLEEEWFLSFKSNKALKCKTTICIDSKEQVRGLDSLCNHLNPQIKPSPAAARLLFWESHSVSVLSDLISHLHLYENNDMFRAACGPKHHGFRLTKTQQSQQSWLRSGTKKLLLRWSKWPLPPTMSTDSKVLSRHEFYNWAVATNTSFLLLMVCNSFFLPPEAPKADRKQPLPVPHSKISCQKKNPSCFPR